MTHVTPVPRVLAAVAAVGASAVLLGGTALASPLPTHPSASPAATSSTLRKPPPPHRCPPNKRWRERWHDGRGWHNPGCW